MNVTRRDALRLAAGAGASMVMAAVDGLAMPKQAMAIAGIDDVALGGLLLVMLTLGGYAVSSAVSDATLQAMGYSFSDFAQDANHQAAAVGRAIADANNLGVEVQRSQAESAAQAIAAGTGAFGEWMQNAITTGRVTLDGWLSGAGPQQAALWGLVTEWRTATLGALATPGLDATMVSNGYRIYDYFGTVRLADLGDFETALGLALPADVAWVWCQSDVWSNLEPGGFTNRTCFCGTAQSLPKIGWYDQTRGEITFTAGRDGHYQLRYENGDFHWVAIGSTTSRLYNERSGYYKGYPIVTPSVLSGGVLPGVDKAADCPETIGAGYDMTPIGADAVINGSDEVVSSGTVALPVQLPGVDVPYVQGLYGLDAGVVPGVVSVPYGADITDVYVGTPTGVVSMPVAQAVTAETSIGAATVPVEPVVPPGTPDVGPWQPGYNLPFQNVWPFNMIYDYVSTLAQLGGE